MKHAWAIRVGCPSNGYFMDNKIFDTKKQAVAYRNGQGDCSWSVHWHVVKIREVSKCPKK